MEELAGTKTLASWLEILCGWSEKKGESRGKRTNEREGLRETKGRGSAGTEGG